MSEWVTLILEELSKLLLKQAIQLLEHLLERVIFLIPKKDMGQRLQTLNSFVYQEHLKMEGIYILKNLLGQGDC